MAGNPLVKKIGSRLAAVGTDEVKWNARAQAIEDSCNPVQRRLIQDKSTRISARCPRRSGKSRGFTSKALSFGERNPNSRILIISLTIKSTKENFWEYAPG